MVDESASSERGRFRRTLVTSGVALESVTADVDRGPAAGIRGPSPRNRIDSHLARSVGRAGEAGPEPERAEPDEVEPEGAEPEGAEPERAEPDGNGSEGSNGSNRRDGGGS